MDVETDVDFEDPKLEVLSLESCKFRATSTSVGREALLRHFPTLTHLTVNLKNFPMIAGTDPNMSNLIALTVVRGREDRECYRSLEQGLALCGGLQALCFSGESRWGFEEGHTSF